MNSTFVNCLSCVFEVIIYKTKTCHFYSVLALFKVLWDQYCVSNPVVFSYTPNSHLLKPPFLGGFLSVLKYSEWSWYQSCGFMHMHLCSFIWAVFIRRDAGIWSCEEVFNTAHQTTQVSPSVHVNRMIPDRSNAVLPVPVWIQITAVKVQREQITNASLRKNNDAIYFWFASSWDVKGSQQAPEDSQCNENRFWILLI